MPIWAIVTFPKDHLIDIVIAYTVEVAYKLFIKNFPVTTKEEYYKLETTPNDNRVLIYYKEPTDTIAKPVMRILKQSFVYTEVDKKGEFDLSELLEDSLAYDESFYTLYPDDKPPLEDFVLPLPPKHDGRECPGCGAYERPCCPYQETPNKKLKQAPMEKFMVKKTSTHNESTK
jgi:hypothetical protein